MNKQEKNKLMKELMKDGLLILTGLYVLIVSAIMLIQMFS